MKRIGRRGFVAGATAGVVVVAGAGLVLVCGGGYEIEPEVAYRLELLVPWEYVVIDAVGARLLAPEQAAVADFADQYLQGLPSADLRDVRMLLHFVEQGAPLLVGHTARFTHLGVSAQDAVLRAVERSPVGRLRQGFAVLKAVAEMAYYSQDSAWSAIGYPGPIVTWGRR